MSYFLSTLALSGSPSRVKVQILRSGEWKHPSAPGGVLRVDDELLSALEESFRSGVRGKELPVNLNHKMTDFAVGWLRDVKREGDSLVGIVDVVDSETAKAIQEQKLRYSSAEILFNYTDPETQQTYPAVLKGLAFTNYPFIKRLEPAQVVNLSEIEEVHLMDERLQQLEEQMAQYEQRLREMQQLTDDLREENAKLRQMNDTLLSETRKQQDELLLKEFEDSVPPAVRKVASALLALARGEEVLLSEFQQDAKGSAGLRELVQILLNEFKAFGRREPAPDELRVAPRRQVGNDVDLLLQKAQELQGNGMPFAQAVREAYRNLKGGV
ncbi:MAG: hypothetical protein KatS3mg023_3891 [Armatimonadota bacterium]|nr:MAG: hypothetical protein KatS3mg023_3891 [Armatimonadota bacterium]